MCLRVRRLRGDCRGITGAIFALTAAVLLGVAALATEVGLWYLGRMQAYAAADAAALAGAAALANGADPDTAKNVANDVALLNGFDNGTNAVRGHIAGASSATVNAHSPPNTGGYTRDLTAVEVDITADFPPVISALFHAADIDVGARAVANLQQIGFACALSLAGDMAIGVNVNADVVRACFIASNATDASAITVSSGVTVSGSGISTRGDCVHCPAVDPLWGSVDPETGIGLFRPPASFQPPTTDPLSGIPGSLSNSFGSQIACPQAGTNLQYNGVQPTLDPNTHCPSTPVPVTITGTMPPTQPDPGNSTITSACGTNYAGTCAYYNMIITIASAVTMQPGAYLLLNSSLEITSAATVICYATNINLGNTNNQCAQYPATLGSGVTIILASTGDTGVNTTGRLYIELGASVNLAASASPAYPPGQGEASLLNGVLFYRDPNTQPPDTAVNPAVVIEDAANLGGGPSLMLQGLMYFPGATAWVAANATVGAGVDASGTAYNLYCSVPIAGTLNLAYFNGQNIITGGQFTPGLQSNWINLDYSCPPYGPGSINPAPQVQAVRLVE